MQIGDQFIVDIIQRTPLRDLTVIILIQQHQHPVDKITQNGYQLIVVLCLKILPGKIIILGFRCIGTQRIAQHVFLTGKILEILMQPHRPVSGRRNFIPFQVQEFIGRHIVG